MQTQNITQDELKELLHYNPETGLFTWAKTIGRAVAGRVAGRKNDHGYHEIGIQRRLHKAHRIAFLYMTGQIPSCQIDHINRVRHDNRWANLRVAPLNQADNCQNRNVRADNAIGLQGVHMVSGNLKVPKWAARICVNGKQIHIGCYLTPDEAHAAYLAKKKELHQFYLN